MARVLWIEDDPRQYRWVYQECAARGIEVVRCRSIAEAELQLLRSPVEQFDLVIVDNVLPDRRDGGDRREGEREDPDPGATFVLQLLSRQQRPRKLLMLTFFEPEESLYQRLSDLGGDDFDVVLKMGLSLKGIVERILKELNMKAVNGGGKG
jgi:DNA-binding response OmpR family regulator